MQGKKEIHKIPSDSLSEKTFEELANLFWIDKKYDSITKWKLANYYLFRAKKKEDKEKIADGYQMFLMIHRKKPLISLQYADSIIYTTKELKENHYPSTGYMIKGNLLSGIERYNEALEAYLIGLKYAEITNNNWQLRGLKHNIALLKNTLGKDREALAVFQENYDYFQKKGQSEKQSNIYIATLYGLSKTYNRIKKYDSAYFYLKDGIKSCMSINGKPYYSDLLYVSGVNSYYREEYDMAIDSLQKALDLFEEDVNKAQVRIGYLFLAKTYVKQKKESKALHYLKKVDAITNDLNYRFEIREAFTLLIDYYRKEEDQGKQLEIMNKVLRYDSISNAKHTSFNNAIITKYDTPQLIKDKNQLISEIKHQNRVSKYRLVFFGVCLMIGISLLFRYFYINRKKAYSKELEKVKALDKTKVKLPKARLDLSKDLKQEILEKLDDFEEKKNYLKNDLTLNKMSKSLKTNSSYLSKVINMEKQKNFANYVNDLRIEYCKEKIEKDKKFRSYSVKSMAQEVGFNNIQSFAKAFFKQEGCNPAEYIKRFDK